MTLTFNKTKMIKLAIFLSMFFGCLLGFNNGHVSAIADHTVTFDALNPLTSNTAICTENCSSYKYVIISQDLNDFAGNAYFYLRINSTNYAQYLAFTNNTTYSLNGNLTYFGIGDVSSRIDSSYYTGGKKLTITLSESNPAATPPSGTLNITENGTFDVSQYASATVNVQATEIIEDPISNDFQKVFFEIVKNIIPAFGILLVVWFGIDMLSSLIFGRGR